MQFNFDLDICSSWSSSSSDCQSIISISSDDSIEVIESNRIVFDKLGLRNNPIIIFSEYTK